METILSFYDHTSTLRSPLDMRSKTSRYSPEANDGRRRMKNGKKMPKKMPMKGMNEKEHAKMMYGKGKKKGKK